MYEDMGLGNTLLSAPLPPIPARDIPYAISMPTVFDMRLSNVILNRNGSTWMWNDIGRGGAGIQSTDDALLNILRVFGGLTHWSRDLDQMSSITPTRSDRTDLFRGVP